MKTDPNREKEVKERDIDTGIYIRAQRGEKWASVDLYELDRESVLEWLSERSIDYHKSTILALLGHEHVEGLG